MKLGSHLSQTQKKTIFTPTKGGTPMTPIINQNQPQQAAPQQQNQNSVTSGICYNQGLFGSIIVNKSNKATINNQVEALPDRVGSSQSQYRMQSQYENPYPKELGSLVATGKNL